jgi:outer membrane protein TolC
MAQHKRRHPAVRLLVLLLLSTAAYCTATPLDTLRLSLAEAVRVATHQSPDAALVGVTRTEGAVALAKGINNLLPSASGSVSYSRSLSEPDSSAARGEWEAKLTLSQVVFDPAAFAGLVTSAARFCYNRASAQDKLAKLVYDVTVDYLSLLKATRLRDVAEASLARARANLNLVQEKRRLGMVSNVDLLRAQVQESQARLGVLQAERSLAKAAVSFNATAGLGRGTTVVPAESLNAPPDSGLESPETLVQEIERRNPGVRMATQSRTIARVNQAAAIGSVLPEVSLYWSAGKRGSSFESVASDWPDAAEPSYGLRASLPLLDLKSYVLNVVDAGNESRRAYIAARATSLLVSSTAVDAVNGYEEARAAFRQSQANLELNRQLHELASEQLKLGAISQVDYSQVEADLVSAEAALVSAATDTYIQAARITYLLGATAHD